jgi:DNA-binding NarL/FixJ family response regulator
MDISDSQEPRNFPRRPAIVVVIGRRILLQTCVLRLLKSELAEFEVFGAKGVEELPGIEGQDIRLIAMDIEDRSFSDGSVIADFEIFSTTFPQTPIAVISDRDDDATANAAMQSGVRGFFSSSTSVDVVLAGFRLVLAGGTYCPPLTSPRGDIHRSFFSHSGGNVDWRRANGQKSNGGQHEDGCRGAFTLTRRETEVMMELQLGHSNKAIALNLGMSENTVKMHIQHLMRKLGARTRTEAVFIWARGTAGSDLPEWVRSH